MIQSHNDSMFLAGKKGFILRRSHQLLDFVGIGEIDHHHPAFTIGIGVHHFRVVFQVGIDLGNGAAHRRVDRGCRLSILKQTDLLPGRDAGTRFRHVDEDNIAQRILGKMTDADRSLRAAHAHPFMLLMVTEVYRNHACSLQEGC